MKFPSQNSVPSEKVRRRWFASLLWRTFPGSSKREKALAAAPVLNLSARQIENLLDGIHDAKLGTILTVLAIAGAENVFDIIAGGESP